MNDESVEPVITEAVEKTAEEIALAEKNSLTIKHFVIDCLFLLLKELYPSSHPMALASLATLIEVTMNNAEEPSKRQESDARILFMLAKESEAFEDLVNTRECVGKYSLLICDFLENNQAAILENSFGTQTVLDAYLINTAAPLITEATLQGQENTETVPG